MNICEQLSVIAADSSATLTKACVWCAISLFAALSLIYLARLAKLYIDRTGRGGRIAQILVMSLTLAAILFGGSKGVFRFENGLINNGSYWTNTTFCARWTYDLLVMESVVKAQYQDQTTNSLGEVTDTWHDLPDALARDSSHNWTVPDSSNLLVVVWAEYVQPPQTHTNGVYKLPGVMRTMDGSDCRYVTPTVRIIANLEDGSQEVLTPTNKPTQSLLSTLNMEVNP